MRQVLAGAVAPSETAPSALPAPAGDLVIHPPRFVSLSADDEQHARAALAELLAPLFRPDAHLGEEQQDPPG